MCVITQQSDAQQSGMYGTPLDATAAAFDAHLAFRLQFRLNRCRDGSSGIPA